MKEYEEWIAKADQDLDTVNYNLKGDKFEVAAFFMQQAAEKALKSLQIKKLGKFFKTHYLVSLSKKLKAPKEILSFSKLLTPAYQYTRYPDVVSPDELKEEIDNLNMLVWR
jgi:HEPN domain-containing protein